MIADRIGNLNASIIFSLLGGLSSLCIWTFAYNYTTLMAYSVAFGFFGGSYYTIRKFFEIHLLSHFLLAIVYIYIYIYIVYAHPE